MNQPAVLCDGYDAIAKYLNAQGNTSVCRYHSAYKLLSDFYIQTCTTQYDPEINRRFRDCERRNLETKAISSKKFKFSRRLSMMMDDYYSGKPFKMRITAFALPAAEAGKRPVHRPQHARGPAGV